MRVWSIGDDGTIWYDDMNGQLRNMKFNRNKEETDEAQKKKKMKQKKKKGKKKTLRSLNADGDEEER